MPHDSWRHTDAVEVPDVVGLHIRDATQRAYEAGLKLAQPDPDGPPLAALTWPDDHWITAQTPPAGTRLWRWDPLVVEWTGAATDGTAGVREPRRPRPLGAGGAAPLPSDPGPESVIRPADVADRTAPWDGRAERPSG